MSATDSAGPSASESATAAEASTDGASTSGGGVTSVETESGSRTASGSESGGSGTDRDGDGAADDVDCHDFHPGVFPGAPEVQDGFDNDCNGDIDEGQPEQTGYAGYGYATVGGAGGDVYHVTTLADGGPESLREGVVDRDGPRVIVFDVSGDITLQSDLVVRAPFLTIDGASAGGEGITIRKTDIFTGQFVITGTHDVIVSHLRFHGLFEDGGPNANNAATLAIDGDAGPDFHARNIVLDHLTSRNATDGGPDVWGEVSDITISYCLLFQSWHPTTVSHYGGGAFQTRQRISFHHNVYARNGERNPQIRADVRELDYVNNTIYDWGYFSGSSGYGIRVRNEDGEPQVNANIVSNAFLPTMRPEWSLVFGITPGPDAFDGDMGELWVEGNLLPPENLDHHSTVDAALPIPEAAQVPTFEPEALGEAALPWVGAAPRTDEEVDLVDEVTAALDTAAGA